MNPASLGSIGGKEARLRELLTNLHSVVVAFSGGVDSTYLLATALDTLGLDRVLAATATSDSYTDWEREEACQLAAGLGVRHRLISGQELDDPDYRANSPDRCYHCKRALLQALELVAAEEGLRAVVVGATVDDQGDHRPGMRAAQEMGVHSPLLEAGLTKAEVRQLSRERGLSTWDKPSMACLASRIPYGTPITAPTLERIAAAESFLRDNLNLRQLRVRDHGTVARIEVDAQAMQKMMRESLRQRVVDEFRRLGYQYVTLDLAGFRSGSMNEVLDLA